MCDTYGCVNCVGVIGVMYMFTDNVHNIVRCCGMVVKCYVVVFVVCCCVDLCVCVCGVVFKLLVLLVLVVMCGMIGISGVIVHEQYHWHCVVG